MADTARSRFYLADDGLKLHYRDFRPEHDAKRTPAICLPGLTRSARDFEPLADALSQGSATLRRVLAFDYRGRGRSAHDPDWHHYDLATERADLLKALASLGITRAHFIGTSRGGLNILGLAAVHREMIASAVFNDIGPVLEPAGLRRIKGYVGKLSAPQSFAEAIAILKSIGPGFDLTPEEWRYFAMSTFGADESQLGLDYDPKLARTLDALDLDKPLADSWALFDKLEGKPVLTIRGANSDLLSEATFAEMATRWPACAGVSVPGQAHAPLLADDPTIARIDRFLAEAEAG